MTVSLRMNTARLQEAVNRVPVKLTKELRKAFRQHGEVFRTTMIRRQFSGGGGISSSSRGNLKRSLRSNVTGRKLSDLRLLITIGGGIASKYTLIQEEGGTIVGKPWLTIPLAGNLTAAGIPRFKSARALQSNPEMKTFLATMPSGKMLIGQRVGRGGKQTRWLWVLLRSVTLKPRLGYYKLWNAPTMQKDRQKRFTKAVRVALESSTSGGGKK